VLDVVVQEGDRISKGDNVVVLEAMKMENVIKSPTDGIVKNVCVAKEEAVEKNQVLIAFK
jgi:biotin carboxyl carrier protein